MKAATALIPVREGNFSLVVVLANSDIIFYLSAIFLRSGIQVNSAIE